MSFSTLLPLFSSSSSRAATLYRAGAATVARLAHALMEQGRNVVVVVPEAAAMGEHKALLSLFSSEESMAEAPAAQARWERPFIVMPGHPASLGGKSGWAERMAALYALRHRRPVQGVLVSLDNFLLRLPPANIFDAHELGLRKGMDMAPDLVLDQAVDWGYTRTPMVGGLGEIALRGDILDIFCPGYAKPLRLEFFGDTLEDIRLFDPISQRSLASLDEMTMLPVAPVIASVALRKEAEAFWKHNVKEGRLAQSDLAGLTRMLDGGGAGLFSGAYYPKASRLEEWLPPDPVFLLPGERDIPSALLEAEHSWSAYLEKERELKGLHQPRSLVLRPWADVPAVFAKRGRVYCTDLRVGVPEETEHAFSLPEKRLAEFREVMASPQAQERPWQHLVAVMRAWSGIRADAASLPAGQGEGEGTAEETTRDLPTAMLAKPHRRAQLVLSFATERARKRFLTLAEQDGVIPKLRYTPEEPGVFALISPFRAGAALEWDTTLVLGEDVMQPRVERARRMPAGAFQGLDRYDSLREGDPLVHRDYGVCTFGGLHRLNLGTIGNDYLLLHYAGEDKLYLPVDRLSLIQRFKGAEGIAPALDKLGGTLWSSSKEKARKAIEKIAADLVEMYALRKVVKGFRYTPINEIYREFEASFGFEETPDQARAIEEVLADMEKAEPMDRLVCGDVGFGKTEVAIRAAFRAALEGRQAAILCPTTILAEQHYQTFKGRLAGFPVNVAMLSRFVTKAKQKEVLEAVRKGQVDILIGTHRLLSKDVELPNLGLLVLDEEQRFGVRHKERLKEMRKNVDALTLTATPIPRTLQLSLSGIRELSIIETPPTDRKPVATALIDRDDATLKQIVEREIAREGQVFWVHNRVQGLTRVAEYVKKLVPHARIGLAHGQMGEKELEDTMHKFWHAELDVLVCTSIVESGLDFPRANTLVVDQAHMFGLGQLYQLRGRVGRSERQAFAVFVTPDPDKLQDIARQRLRIILDMDYLGAGFQVAMEDLRLRGAGNILGESQSGHMNRLGLDLFLEMLEEAVAKLKGSNMPVFAETELSLCIPAFIPEEYMPDNKERLRYYKLLSSAPTQAEMQEVVFEMRDRFGKVPQELHNFVEVLAFKRIATKYGIAKADIYPDKVRLAFTEQSAPDPAALIAFVTEQREKGVALRLQPPCVLEVPMGAGEVAEGLAFVTGLLRTAPLVQPLAS
ncbi:transcription-repair coupling factor [Desulfovibrio cuneatus]|uniref:transcription-repair coupling factor n=1 Tax=Desulfovibrio cuneatus TaxID=159728 RepID=UPI0006865A1C